MGNNFYFYFDLLQNNITLQPIPIAQHPPNHSCHAKCVEIKLRVTITESHHVKAVRYV